MTREQAVENGRALGAEEAVRRGEVADERQDRINRAMAYAAWEWDGKLADSHGQRREFGVAESDLKGSLDRSVFGRLLRKP